MPRFITFPEWSAPVCSCFAVSPFSYYVSLALSPCVDYKSALGLLSLSSFFWVDTCRTYCTLLYKCICICGMVFWYIFRVRRRLCWCSPRFQNTKFHLKGSIFSAQKDRNAESIEWFIEGHAFFRSYDLAPPPPSLPSVRWTGNTQEDWERETTCWRKKRGEGGGRGAKSYDGKKTSSSIII